MSSGNLDQQKFSQDVRLPVEANDSDLVDDRPVPFPSGSTQMTCLLFKFRLEIEVQQDAWRMRNFSHSNVQPLPNHHVAHMNILFGYSNQLFLLLHPPALNRYLSGETNSATRLSAIQKTLSESPAFAPYKWSSLCEKAAPILGRLMCVLIPIPPDPACCPSPSSMASTTSSVAQLSPNSVSLDACQYVHEQQQPVPRAHCHHLAQTQPQYPLVDPQSEPVHTQLQGEFWLDPSAITWVIAPHALPSSPHGP
ncbi:hypothetical protein CIHG_03235 [Coccidioides immitis H538.4]|uniref:Uncharacterized protein n=3 Tax=Coccidioides immitis TaxID=5501 RepID=A0A0J8QU23_COCIT|nr:hypothetical protein CIRG_00928 [Coccidioides immitis RMSCC 2394]KMU75555.1 hypothetical protein CISG_04958 [Coccidioides immitis RMSCC 3703]KMU85453.1 hypothetical protein CIHG_03235 [Coccidioides immitis H538.4]